MADVISGNIKKIKLSDGRIFSIFDQGALRLDPTSKVILTGVDPVDEAILDGHLSITHIDDVPLADVQYDVIISQQVGTDPETGEAIFGEIKREDIRLVLSKLGQLVSGWENIDGKLTLKYYAYSKPNNEN